MQKTYPAAEALVAAVDLGGTQTRVALVDAEGHLLARRAMRTEPEKGPQDVLERIAGSLAECLAATPPGARPVGIGVGAPGPLDPWRGIIFFAPNMPGWKDVPLKQILEERFGLPTVVGNDANVAAVGERRFGAARGHDEVVYLTISTGVGSGVITGGKLLLGSRGIAGEAGHMTIDMHGPVCACGNRGCLEVYASGTAIARVAADRLRAGEKSSLAALNRPPTAAEVADAAEAGDALARSVLVNAATALGIGITSLVHLLNPSIVVLGGGVSRSGPIWWDTVRRTVEETAMPVFRTDLRIVPSALGDDVGLLGAAAAAFQEVARPAPSR